MGMLSKGAIQKRQGLILDFSPETKFEPNLGRRESSELARRQRTFKNEEGRSMWETDKHNWLLS